MTFSLVARDDDGDVPGFGVATASKYLAVGATVPAVAPGVGALVTQAHTNVLYRDAGLGMLRRGSTAARTVHGLTEGDPGRSLRQVAVVGPTGSPAAWTGSDCSPFAAHLLSHRCVAVGNLLAGADVLTSMVAAFESTDGTLARRLLAGLAAGETAGGDRRGRQSAALLVASGAGVPQLRTPARVDLRVDDHPDPVGELDRLLGRHELLVGEPDRTAALPLDGTVALEVAALLADLGHDTGALPDRLAAWAATENLTHRLLPGAVDPAVLQDLRARARPLPLVQ